MINVQDFKIDAGEVNPISISLLQGEAVEFHFTLFADGIKIPLVSSAEVYYRHDEMEEGLWYRDSAQVSNGVVIWQWDSSLDVGAKKYSWFVRARGSSTSDVSYRILGKFNMLKSPNFTPNQIPLPRQTLDFADIEVLNAPYYTKSEINSELNSIDARINGHDDEIDEAKETLRQHKSNHNNPHRVRVEQLTKKSASSGLCGVVWGASDYYKQGEIRFYFDPAMYRRGNGLVQITMPDYLPPVDGVDIGGVSVSYSGEFVLAEQGNHTGWIFRSTTTQNVNGLDLYIFASINVTDLLKRESSYAVWVGVGTNTNPTDYSHSAEVVTASFDSSTTYSPITNSNYTPSGIYKVLTEEVLRDEETGLPYTLKVSNGELHLVRYREESFEG